MFEQFDDCEQFDGDRTVFEVITIYYFLYEFVYKDVMRSSAIASNIHEKLCWWSEQILPSADKESPYPLGNGFLRALESRFLVSKNEAQCSHFRPMGPFSWDMGNFVLNILCFVKKWCLFYWLSHCKYLRYENEEKKL